MTWVGASDFANKMLLASSEKLLLVSRCVFVGVKTWCPQGLT